MVQDRRAGSIIANALEWVLSLLLPFETFLIPVAHKQSVIKLRYVYTYIGMRTSLLI